MEECGGFLAREDGRDLMHNIKCKEGECKAWLSEKEPEGLPEPTEANSLHLSGPIPDGVQLRPVGSSPGQGQSHARDHPA